jgi:methylglyoxal reductase
MKRRMLGQSNIEVSPIILGTWAIGGWMWGGSNEKDAIEAIQTSIDHGINTIDTAAIYGMGHSEELVGKAIRGRRDRVVIATKCGMRWTGKEGTDPWPQKDLAGRDIVIRKNSKPESIIFECEQSLKRLGTDVIDLYQIHWPDISTPIEESWAAMARLKQQGKVRAIGVSNFNVEEMSRALTVAPIDSDQPSYSLIHRGIEKEILPFCRENDISVIVYSPLERGLLTGEITLDREFPSGDHRRDHPLFSIENRKRVLAALEKIRPIANVYGVNFAQLIINWTIHEPGITAALVGARNAHQAAENAKALSFQLKDQDRAKIRQTFDELAINV